MADRLYLSPKCPRAYNIASKHGNNCGERRKVRLVAEDVLAPRRDGVCSFPAGSEQFPGPGPAREKTKLSRRGSWALMPLSTKTGGTRSGGGMVSWTMKTGFLATGHMRALQTKETEPQLWLCFSFRACTEQIFHEVPSILPVC